MESVMAKKVRSYRRYPVGMKQQVLGRMAAGENVKALARELGIDRTLLYVWKRKAAGQPYSGAAGGPQDLRE
jgi:transposase-like protein